MPKLVAPRSKLVVTSRPRNSAESRPNSDAVAVWTTSAEPVPVSTCVPMNTALVLADSGASCATASPFLATGYDSPVSTDSSTSSPVDVSTRQSAGTTLPGVSSTTSPTTSWSVGISVSSPSRSTCVMGCTCDVSASTALPALCSCQNPRVPLAAMMPRMMRASMTSPSRSETTVAPMSMSTMGLVNWAMKSRNPRAPRCTGSEFGPFAASRRRASSAERPTSPEPSALATAS